MSTIQLTAKNCYGLQTELQQELWEDYIMTRLINPPNISSAETARRCIVLDSINKLGACISYIGHVKLYCPTIY